MDVIKEEDENEEENEKPSDQKINQIDNSK